MNKEFKVGVVIFVCLFAFNLSWADLGGARPLGSECLSPDDDCTAMAYQNAQLAAQERALTVFEQVAREADRNQSEICQTQVATFREACTASMYQTLKDNAEEIQRQIDEKTQIAARTQREITGEISQPSTIQGIIDRLSVLNTDIEKLLADLAVIKTSTEDLDTSCRTNRINVENVCRAPQAELVNGSSVIVQVANVEVQNRENNSDNVTSTMSRPIRTPVPPAQAIAFDVEAEAVATVTGTIAAPLVAERRQGFEREYYTTSRSAGFAHEQIGAAETLGTDTFTRTFNMIQSLQSLIAEGRTVETAGGCDTIAGAACGTAAPTTSPTPPQRPDGLGATAGRTSPTDTGAATGSNRGVTGQDIIDGVNRGPGYGANPANPANQTPGQTGSGGLMNSLSGLGSMFGKTGGGFGSEGYRSSANSRFGGNDNNNNGRSGPGFNLNNGSVDYTLNNRDDRSDPNAPQPRAFNGNLGNTGQNGFAGAAPGGGAAGLGGGGAPGASGGNAGNKPGLLNRLLGKKRDKTMFGKAESSGRGGSFGSGASARAGSGAGVNAAGENTAQYDQNGQRIFDASKYAPTAEAQARAYARATGRKIASTVPRPDGGTDWPSDISKDRNGNMFTKVNLTHTTFINMDFSEALNDRFNMGTPKNAPQQLQPESRGIASIPNRETPGQKLDRIFERRPEMVPDSSNKTRNAGVPDSVPRNLLQAVAACVEDMKLKGGTISKGKLESIKIGCRKKYQSRQ